MLSIEVRGHDFSRFMDRLFHDQIPFATAKAINDTAKDFQEAERAGMVDRFTIRRPWVLKGIKINRGEFATKRHLIARVHVDYARSFLVQHEKGGTKRPRGQRIAVPDKVRRTKAGVVPRSMRPLSLSFHRSGQRRGVTIWKGDKRTFMIRRPGGRGGIYQRYGRRGRHGRVRQLFSFTPAAKIEPRLEFEDTAVTVVAARFSSNYSRAFAAAVQGAR